MSKKSFVHFDLRRKWFAPGIIKRIYAIGLSPFLVNLCACVVVMFLNKALLSCDDVDGKPCRRRVRDIEPHDDVFVMIVFGVTQGMQPILGYTWAAGQWDRVKRTLKMGVWIGVAITSIGWVITEVFPDLVTLDVHHR